MTILWQIGILCSDRQTRCKMTFFVFVCEQLINRIITDFRGLYFLARSKSIGRQIWNKPPKPFPCLVKQLFRAQGCANN